MILNLSEYERYVRAIADRACLQVVWTEAGTCPMTDGKRISCPIVNAGTSEEQYFKTLSSLTHEVSHVLFSSFTLLKDAKLAPDSKLGAVWNIFEDARIEELMGALYRGDKQLFDHDLNGFVQIFASGKWNPEVYADTIVFVACCIHFAARVEDNPALGLLFEDVLKIANPEQKELLDKSADLVQMLRNTFLISDPEKGTAATYEVACKLFENADENPEDHKGEAPPEEKPEGGDGDSGGEGEGEGKEASGKSKEAKEGEGKDKAKGKVKIKWSELTMSKPKTSPTKKGDFAKVDYDSYGHDSYKQPPLSEYQILPKKTSAKPNPESQRMYESSCGFSNRIKQVLQIALRNRWQYGLKKGKLNNNSLHRVTIQDAGSYGERVFKDKVERNGIDVAMYVLLDMSGSMHGSSKIEHASAAVALLSDMANAINIPTCIEGFSDVDRTTIMPIRDFGERIVPAERILKDIGGYESQMLDNADGEALLWAYNKLLPRKEKRKVMLVLSDGQPYGGHGRGDIAAYTKQVAQAIEKDHRVEIYSIGIMDSTVEEFYKNYAIINSADKLEETLLNLVKTNVLGV